MKNIFLLIHMTMFYTLFGARLTLEEAIVESPFEIASIGGITSFPNEDAVLVRGKNNNWKQWYKVDLVLNDTSLFIDSSAFNLNGDDLYVSDITFSNRGDILLVKTKTEKIYRHSHISTYYIYDLSKKKLSKLTSFNKNLRNVKFSPTDKHIGYIREDNNLYVYDIKRKRQRQLTTSGSNTISNGHFGWLYEEELTGYDGYRWSPDGSSIAYWEEDESLVPEFSLIDDLVKYPLVKKIRYPKAGDRNPTLRIGIVRVNGAGRKWIEGAYVENDYLPWMKWVNENKVAFLKMDRSQKIWNLFVADRLTGRAIKVLSEYDQDGWVDNHGQIYFLKDGKIILLSEKSGYMHIWMSKHSGSNIWPITVGKWEVSSITKIDEDSKLIYFIANKESVHEKKLYSIRFDGTDLKLLTPEKGNHSIFLTGTRERFIDSYSSTDIPKRILLKNLYNREEVRVLGETDIGQFIDYDWSYPQIIKFRSLDNTVDLHGVITLPPDHSFENKYPVIIHGYGMPGTQIVWNRWSSMWNQYLAQQGYIVFSMDTRGMGGRGEAFKNLSYGDMSKYLANDQIAGIDFLVKEGYADPDKIGAWGWSGGGYFTCLMLTRNAKFFKAGVAVAPCTDFRLYDTAYTERYMGMPEENTVGYDSTSVMSWINRMNGSILLMHGASDDNVHSQHTNKFVQAALQSGKDVEWYEYPRRDHGIYGGGARKHLYKKMIEFFNEKL